MDIGSRVGPYEIREHIGEGGMAVVYKVWHTGLHRFEALKVPRFQGTQSIHPDFIQRLLSEARIAAQLHHPHIVAIHNVSEPESAVQFFAMDLVEGRDLAEVLQQWHQLPLAEVIAIMRQVASALDYAHSRGFIHRDIKPGNILLGVASASAANTPNAWNAKVVDFGISRAAEDNGGTRLTKSGMIVGTPEYMSPEQAGSGALVDYRTDIYSLGIVAYEMLAGHPPFTAGDGVSRMSILLSHVHHLPRPLTEQISTLEQAANNAVLKALAKAPAARFQSCAEFAQALAGEVLVALPLPSEGLTAAPQIAPSASAHPAAFNVPRFLAPPQTTGNPATSLGTASEMPTLAETVPPPRPANPVAATLDAPFSPPVTPLPPAPPGTAAPDGAERVARRAKTRQPATPLLIAFGAVALGLIGAAIFAFNHGSGPQAIAPVNAPTPPTPVATVAAPNIEATVAAPVIEATAEATPTEAAMPTDVATPTDVTAVAPKPQIQRLKLTRAIAFPKRLEKTAALPLGRKKLKQAGRAGQQEVIVKIVKRGTRQLARSIISNRTLKAPVPQIELLGTAPPKIKRPVRHHNLAPHHLAPHRTIPHRTVPRHVPIHRQPHFYQPRHRTPAHHSAAPHHVREAPLPP